MGIIRVGFVTCAFLVGMTGRARAECKPAAIPHGDPTLVQSVSARLAASGIATVTDAGCPAVRVKLEQRGQRVHLRVTDAFERLGEREVRDVATAAAIIESWTLQEIEAGTLPAERVADVPVVVPVRAPASGVAIAMRTAVASGSATWIGGSVAACAKVGWACIGATLRAAKDTEATGNTTSGDHHLSQYDGVATFDVPRMLGGFVISPGAEVGYALLRVSSTHLDAHMMPFTTDESSHALRAGLHVRISHALTSRIAFYSELAGDASLARTSITGGPTTAFGISLGARLEVP